MRSIGCCSACWPIWESLARSDECRGTSEVGIEMRHGAEMTGKFLLAIGLCAAWLSGSVQAGEKPYDLVLRNARIVDGTGSPWYRADLAVRGDTIARIAPAITEPAARVIDVGGTVVAPGFIDLHTHAIRGIF